MAKSNFLNLEIISPQGLIFEGEVDSITLPTYNGNITILPNHTPLFTKLAEGEVHIATGNKDFSVVIAGGFLEISSNYVSLMSDYAIRAESIETAKAEEKKRMAEQRLKEKSSNRDFTLADKDLKMSILELKVAQKIKKRHQT